MRRASLLACTLALAFVGCGGGDKGADTTTARTAPATTPSTTTTADQEATGAVFVEQSGCLACHQIGTRGSSGPGSNLSGVGERRSPAEIRGALLQAPAPMPSYSHLSRRTLDAIVAYLSSLRSDCPDGSDCG